MNLERQRLYVKCILPENIKALDILAGRQTVELKNFSHYLIRLGQLMEVWRKGPYLDNESRYAKIEKELPPLRGR